MVQLVLPGACPCLPAALAGPTRAEREGRGGEAPAPLVACSRIRKHATFACISVAPSVRLACHLCDAQKRVAAGLLFMSLGAQCRCRRAKPLQHGCRLSGALVHACGARAEQREHVRTGISHLRERCVGLGGTGGSRRPPPCASGAHPRARRPFTRSRLAPAVPCPVQNSAPPAQPRADPPTPQRLPATPDVRAAPSAPPSPAPPPSLAAGSAAATRATCSQLPGRR